MLLQEKAKTHWHHFVAVLLLDERPTNLFVEGAYRKILERWPNPFALYNAPVKDLKKLLESHKINSEIAQNLKDMSGVIRWWNGNPKSLPGVGEYGAQSFKLIVLKEANTKPTYPDLIQYKRDR